MKIARVIGREVYDSRGWPTLLVELLLSDGSLFTGYTPSDSVSSRYQAHEKLDNDKRFGGKGVRKAIATIDEVVAPFLVGKEPIIPELDFALISLDGTTDKSNLGSNVLIALSMALYRAHAFIERVELYELLAYLVGADSVTLPCPQVTLLTGIRTINENLCIQECMIAPIGSSTLQEALEASFTLYHELKNMLFVRGKLVGFGDNGGLVAPFHDDRQALDIVLEAVEQAMHNGAQGFGIALNIGANHLYDESFERYRVHGQAITRQELVNFYNELVQTYPIYSIEDGLSENDWEGWRLLTETLGDKVQVVGGDVFATSPDRLNKVTDYNVATAVLIKPHQIGTITQAVQMINLCKKYQLNPIVSLGGGETEDSFIADLAIGTSAGQIKAGGCCRSEHVAKYNRLLAIEESLISGRDRFLL